MRLKAYCVSVLLVLTGTLVCVLCYPGISNASPEDQPKLSKPTGVLKWTKPPALPCVEFPVDKRGLESEGFTLKAELAQAAVSAGSRVTVKLTLNCTAGQDREIWQTMPAADYVLFVEGPRSIEYRIQHKPVATFRNAERKLKAGDVVAEDYDASNVFDFQREGTYRITLGRVVPKLRGKGYGVVLSNTVDLKVSGSAGTSEGR